MADSDSKPFVASVQVIFGDGTRFTIDMDGPAAEQGTSWDPGVPEGAQELESRILAAVQDTGFNPPR